MKKSISRSLCALLTVTIMASFQVSCNAGEATLHLAWTWPTDEGMTGFRPEIAIGPDNTIYAIDYAGILHAISHGGEELWEYRTDGFFPYPPVLSADGQTIYILEYDRTLTALDRAGNIRWEFVAETPFTFRSIPNVAPDGTIYLDTEGNGYRITPDDGNTTPFTWPRWVDPMNIAFDDQGNIYIPGLSDIQIVNPNGDQVSTCQINDFVYNISTVEDYFYYSFANYPDDPGLAVVAQDIHCQMLWSYQTDLSCGEDWTCPLVRNENGTIFAGGQYGKVYALSGRNGDLLWNNAGEETDGDVIQLASEGNNLYALRSDGKLIAYNSGSGDELFRIDTPATGIPGPIVFTTDDGLAFVLGDQLLMYATDPNIGSAEQAAVAPPNNYAEAEQEIVDFLLEEVTRDPNYDISTGTPWNNPPDSAELIVWLSGHFHEAVGEYDGTPQVVWWYTQGMLIETEDMSRSIEEYRDLYIQDEDWSTTGFGIISISDDFQQAEVYLARSYGPLAGEGLLLTLQRGNDGYWQIIRSETLWVS